MSKTSSSSNQTKRILFIYSLLFAAMSLIIFRYFFVNSKTFIHGDGLLQHYKALIYYSDYLKDLFRNIFVKHDFTIPQFDLSIGEGADILVTLQYYCIGDPIAFLSVFVPKEYLYVFYDLSIILRIYLSGLVFISLCLYTKNDDPYAVLSGSMIYVFCYWSLLNSTKHIFFLNPMIYFPLIILGVEMIIREDRPVLLTIAVFFSALNNFYFFYMIVVLTVVYVAVRLLILYKMDFRTMLGKLLKIFIFSLTGFLLSAVISFPMIHALLSSDRLNVDYGLHPLYPKFYYEKLTSILLANDDDYWLCMGFASPVILSFLTTLRIAVRKPLLLVLNILTVMFFCFPIFGKVLNGFAYVSNRWSFAVALTAAYTFVSNQKEFETHKRYLLVSATFFCLYCLVSAWWREVKIVPVMICMVYLLVVIFVQDPSRNKIKQTFLLVLVLANILYIADHSYSDRGSNRVRGASSVEDAKSVITSTEAYAFLKDSGVSDDKEFVRYSGNVLTENAAMLAGTHATDFYFSIANPNVAAYRNALGVNEYSSYRYQAYDNRAILYTLANVSYYLTPENYTGILPYGFEKIKSFDGYDMYLNQNALPFGYTYEKAISYDDWYKMSQIEREEALLSYIVIDTDRSEQIKQECVKVNYEIIPQENVRLAENTVFVEKDGSSIVIKTDGLPNTQTYLSVSKIRYDDEEDYFSGDVLTDAIMTLQTDEGMENVIEYHTNDYQFYNARDSFSAFLGNSSSGVKEIKVTFSRKGTYTFEDLYVSCLPAGSYKTKTEQLKKVCLKDYEFGVNKIFGKIDTDAERYLLLSIPYSSGWKAFVDGNESTLYKANESYMALKVSKGAHTIELRYETPLMKAGAAVSISTAAFCVIYLIVRKKKQ